MASADFEANTKNRIIFPLFESKSNIMSLLDQQEIVDQDQITGATLSYLLKTAKWMQFIAITGFIFIGIFAVAIFAIPDLMLFQNNTDGLAMSGSGDTSAMLIGFVVILLFTFFPNLFLYQSAINFIRYARDNNSFNLEVGFKKLHSLFLYVGIIVIIYLAIFVLAIMLGGML